MALVGGREQRRRHGGRVASPFATLMTSSNFDGSSFVIFALKRIIQYLVDSRVEGITRIAVIADINWDRNATVNITFVAPLAKGDISLLSDDVTFPT